MQAWDRLGYSKVSFFCLYPLLQTVKDESWKHQLWKQKTEKEMTISNPEWPENVNTAKEGVLLIENVFVTISAAFMTQKKIKFPWLLS